MCSLELVSLQATMKRTLIVAFDRATGERAVKRVCFGTPLTEVNLRQWHEEMGPFDPEECQPLADPLPCVRHSTG